MPDLDVAWPPAPIRTVRLTLRAADDRDVAPLVELHCSPEVGAHLGGPRDRDDAERAVRSALTTPGRFVVDLDRTTIGTVTLDRRDPARPGRLRPDGGDLEVSYLFLPAAWGHGYATEAVTAVLHWVTTAVPGEPVVLCTQVANLASVRLAERVGFRESARFEEFRSHQWFGVLDP